MMTIDEYMKLPYPVELISDTDEGGFTAAVPSLPGCLSVGETVEDAYRNIEDAKHEWLEAAIEEGIAIPEPDSINDYSGQFKLRIPKTLHRQLQELVADLERNARTAAMASSVPTIQFPEEDEKYNSARKYGFA